jgi:hypothetical protein
MENHDDETHAGQTKRMTVTTTSEDDRKVANKNIPSRSNEDPPNETSQGKTLHDTRI